MKPDVYKKYDMLGDKSFDHISKRIGNIVRGLTPQKRMEYLQIIRCHIDVVLDRFETLYGEK